MLNKLTLKQNVRAFSVSPENITGEKGAGAKTEPQNGSAAHAAQELGKGWKVNPYFVLEGDGAVTVLADIKGQGAIKHIWVTDSASARQLILRIYFDGHKSPAVEAPLGDFFCNASYEFRRLSSIAMCLNPARGMNSYFEMPYFKGFRIEVQNLGKPCNIYYQIDCEEKEIPKNSLYFHAQFRRTNPLPYAVPYTILDNIKGNGQ